jgi:predicted transcriptional regulator
VCDGTRSHENCWDCTDAWHDSAPPRQHLSPLYERRVAAGLRLRDLAAQVGITPRELGDIEWGRTDPPADVLAKINEVLK